METSNFTLPKIVFKGETQAEADAKRDAWLLDFCKINGLHIYEEDATTVDPKKITPAVREHILEQMRHQVRQYRANRAAVKAHEAQSQAGDDF